LFASFSSSSFWKKIQQNLAVPRLQNGPSHRINGQVPDDGSHWDDAFAVSWMTGYLIG